MLFQLVTVFRQQFTNEEIRCGCLRKNQCGQEQRLPETLRYKALQHIQEYCVQRTDTQDGSGRRQQIAAFGRQDGKAGQSEQMCKRIILRQNQKQADCCLHDTYSPSVRNS